MRLIVSRRVAAEKDTSELRFDVGGIEERMHVRFGDVFHVDEHYVHDVISDVPFPFNLLTIVLRKWQQG